VEYLFSEYTYLFNDSDITMADTPKFPKYKQYIKYLSSWLTSTNADIHKAVQSINKQQALLIIKVCQGQNC
jgi:hypothetical protein